MQHAPTFDNLSATYGTGGIIVLVHKTHLQDANLFHERVIEGRLSRLVLKYKISYDMHDTGVGGTGASLACDMHNSSSSSSYNLLPSQYSTSVPNSASARLPQSECGLNSSDKSLEVSLVIWGAHDYSWSVDESGYASPSSHRIEIQLTLTLLAMLSFLQGVLIDLARAKIEFILTP